MLLRKTIIFNDFFKLNYFLTATFPLGKGVASKPFKTSASLGRVHLIEKVFIVYIGTSKIVNQRGFFLFWISYYIYVDIDHGLLFRQKINKQDMENFREFLWVISSILSLLFLKSAIYTTCFCKQRKKRPSWEVAAGATSL